MTGRRGALITGTVAALTVVQLGLATFGDLPQFEGKAFGARLVFYPLMMAVAPLAWWLLRGRGGGRPVPWAAFALIMAPFLVDVTGNTLDLYDRVWWWDDANHFANWFLLCLGVGLLMAPGWRAAPWQLALCVAGIGAMLAIGWEIGEWWTFIRHGVERLTAYEDTLGDLALGTLGGSVAGAVVALRARARA